MVEEVERIERGSWLVYEASGEILHTVTGTRRSAELNAPAGCAILKTATDRVDSRSTYVCDGAETPRPVFVFPAALLDPVAAGSAIEWAAPAGTMVGVNGTAPEPFDGTFEFPGAGLFDLAVTCFPYRDALLRVEVQP